MRVERNGGCRIASRLMSLAPLAACALLAAGCSSSSTIGTEASLSQAMATTASAAAPGTPSGNLERCPNVDLRQGAATLTINTNPRDPSAMQLRYQISVGQTARECQGIAGNLVMRVGVQGRVVLGPAGGPGVIDVPLRFAVVEEGVQPKTIWTKLQRVPVTVAEGQPSVAFTHIEEGITIPMPPNAAFDNYMIYVGFDPIGAVDEMKKRQPAKKRPARQS